MNDFQAMTVLIVDDDEGHRVLISESLRDGGWTGQIVEAANGQEVLDYLYRREPAAGSAEKESLVILLDIKMPVLDGFEVLKEIKTNERLMSIPVMMLTSTDDQNEVDRCYQLGANGYLVKPIKYEDFYESIRALGSFLGVLTFPG